MSEGGAQSEADTALARLRASVASGWERTKAFQDRIRDPSLTIILVLEVFLIFVAAPLAVQGLPLAETVSRWLVWGMVLLVVLLSHSPGAIIMIVLGLTLGLADLSGLQGWAPNALSVLRGGGDILAFSALTWVVGHSVFAPGRITAQRLQGAAVVYLNLGICFAFAYRLIHELDPGAFSNVPVNPDAALDLAPLLYFSLTVLTTTGFGDIVAVQPFARSMANLEAVVGQFYFAVTIARLVTLGWSDRR